MFRKVASSTVALCVAASPVFAQVTPVEVWDNLAAYYGKFGYQLTEGGREQAGDTLTVTDVTVTFPDMPDGDARFTLPKVVLQQTGDGGVRTVFEGDITGTLVPQTDAPDQAAAGSPPPSDAAAPAAPTDAAGPASDGAPADGAPADGAPAEGAPADGTAPTDAPTDTPTPEAGASTTEGTDADETPATPDPATLDSVSITLAVPGNEMITSGTPEAMTHRLAYPAFDLSMMFESSDGTSFPVTVTARDTAGSYSTEGADVARSVYDMKVAELAMTMDLSGIEGADGGDIEKGMVNAALTDLAITGESTVPDGQTGFAADMNAALSAGATMTGALNWGAMTGDFDFAATSAEGRAQSGKGSGTSDGGSLTLTMSKDGLGYAGSARNSAFNLETSTLPVPVGYAVAESSFDVMMPVTAADTPSPFRFALKLTDMTLADGVWSLFDPQSQLPRDPASLVIDLAGALKVTRDLFDTSFNQRMAAATTVQGGQSELTDEQIAAIAELQAEAVPYEPQSITVNEVSLKAAGASAEIRGDLAVPEGGSVNAPVGTLTGNFTGLNTLIDTLAAMGLVAQEQVAGTKMMMMAFAKPVEGQPDALTTELEFREGGAIFANGQKIK